MDNNKIQDAKNDDNREDKMDLIRRAESLRQAYCDTKTREAFTETAQNQLDIDVGTAALVWYVIDAVVDLGAG